MASGSRSTTGRPSAADPTFVGTQNYERILHDPLFWQALGHTVLFTALATPSLIALGMGLALVLNRALPGGGIFRTLFYLPNMLSTCRSSASSSWPS